MIAYRKSAAGQATDIRFVPDDYQAEPGEFLIDGDELPDARSLSDAAAVAADDKIAAALAIDAQRESALAAGVSFGGRLHHLDDRFTLELMGMILGLQLGVLVGVQRVRTMTNQIVELDAAALTQLAGACAARRRAIYEQSWAAKDALA